MLSVFSKFKSNNLFFLHFEDKFTENEMFPKEFIDRFREYKEGEDFQIDSDVRKAWMSFVLEFCRSVSYHWKNYLRNIGKREIATFDGNLSTSDEAFAMWVIYCKYDEAKAESEEIKKVGLAKWKDSRKRKRFGTHDSKGQIDQYVRLYNTISTNRKNPDSSKLWQDVFFEDFFNDPDRTGPSGSQDQGNDPTNPDSLENVLSLPGEDEDIVDKENPSLFA